MGKLIADVILTTCGRHDFVQATLRSLGESTDPSTYRLTVVDDGGMGDIAFTPGASEDVDIYRLISHGRNMGLGPSLNEALAVVNAQQLWEGKDAPPFICYVQDDLTFQDGWLEKLAKFHTLFEFQHRIAFSSGHDAPEHDKTIRKDLGGGMLLKDWVRATNMMARRQTWMDMWPIPPVDPETGRLRGKPNDGLGSGVDWHFLRVHPKSPCRAGGTNLVIPGLVRHAGAAHSTWLRPGTVLPEKS